MPIGKPASWGRWPRASQEISEYHWRHQPLPDHGSGKFAFLPFGNGRSYGDVCLNDGGMLLDCRGLNRFIGLDEQTGILSCEAGVLLADIVRLSVPRGWFLPVTPGTRFVTVGGAIANDVHGKNHPTEGTFGRHVDRLELLRSDGSRAYCSSTENSQRFQATIGGLGLTGVITRADLQLKCIPGPYIQQEVVRQENLEEFFALEEESSADFDYRLAWLDCHARGKALGRGLYIRGRHADTPINARAPRSTQFSFPFTPQFSLINRFSVDLFNSLHYRKQVSKRRSGAVHFEPFFYPLDALGDWNRLYGPRGFLQFQCVLPENAAQYALSDILQRVSESKSGSFLTTLKPFGKLVSPGLLSFPMPGLSLAIDFPNRPVSTHKVLADLYAITRQAGGRVYPAKDACMPAHDFQQAYPLWREMLKHRDPAISSGFWRRVTTS